MSENLDKELQALLKQLQPLDPIPEDVDRRFEETLHSLKSETSVKKRTWFNPNSFALAAGFLVVVSLGITFTLSNENEASTSIVQSDVGRENSSDILVGNNLNPNSLSDAVQLFKSGIDYKLSPKLREFPFTPLNSYYDTKSVQKSFLNCLISLGIEESVSLIDRGTYSGLQISAVWSAIEKGKWQVAIIDKQCEPIDQILISE